MHARFRTTAYRYPSEYWILGVTLLIVLAVIGFTALATFCLSPLLVLVMLAFSYFAMTSQHRALVQQAEKVSPQNAPGLVALANQAGGRLQVDPVEIFIAPSRVPNAYTFGLSSPKTIVLHAGLFDLMDPDEIQFVLGHEMGHVCLGHTWLNSLVGGMAGVPAPSEASLLMVMAFRWWNRACEYSADRAGLLACGKPQKAISALIKLQAGPGLHSQTSLDRALRTIESQEGGLAGDLAELMQTHPLIYHRIDQLRRYAQSPQYARLQNLVNSNQ